MTRRFSILSIAGEPDFATEQEAAAHAQKLANEEGESVWYETEAGEAECVPTAETWHCPHCDADVTDDEEIRHTSRLNVSCPQCHRLMSHDDTSPSAIVFRRT